MFQNNVGSFVSPTNFRRRVWKKLVKKALGAARMPTHHALRHWTAPDSTIRQHPQQEYVSAQTKATGT